MTWIFKNNFEKNLKKTNYFQSGSNKFRIKWGSILFLNTFFVFLLNRVYAYTIHSNCIPIWNFQNAMTLDSEKTRNENYTIFLVLTKIPMNGYKRYSLNSDDDTSMSTQSIFCINSLIYLHIRSSDDNHY